MIESVFTNLAQFNVYHNSLQPIEHYYREYSKVPMGG